MTLAPYNHTTTGKSRIKYRVQCPVLDTNTFKRVMMKVCKGKINLNYRFKLSNDTPAEKGKVKRSCSTDGTHQLKKIFSFSTENKI